MLDFARGIIGSQPILTAFLAIGVGYLVGQISIGGFSLGVGAVLFVGPRAWRIRTRGQDCRPHRTNRAGIMFLLRRRHYFTRPAVLRGHDRRRRAKNTICLLSSPLPLVPPSPLGSVTSSASKSGTRSAFFAGSMTSTATLQAALDTMKNGSDPSIGYSVAYPFGVIGPILCICIS